MLEGPYGRPGLRVSTADSDLPLLAGGSELARAWSIAHRGDTTDQCRSALTIK